MSRIKALGTHVYFGGFAIGVARNENIKVLGSLESWKPAVTWAPKLGVRVSTTGVVPKADYLFANPPCARFSPMSYSKFESEMRTDLTTFPEMNEALLAGKYSGAELVHIESGPLMYNNGKELISQFNDVLQWPECYMLVLKVGTMYAGLPQLRPRTHVFLGKRPFPEIDLTPVEVPNNIGVFIDAWNAEYQYEGVQSMPMADPVVYSAMQKNQAVFLSTRPKIVSRNDRYCHSVVSSRHFVWLEENRSFTVDEYAAVQGYNPDFDYSAPGIPLAMALISKSVSPAITEYLAERVVVPYFDSDVRDPHRPMYVDLT